MMTPPVSRAKAYLKARHQTVRKAMDELSLDALLLTHPGDLAWLTDFEGHDSVGIITAKQVYLVTDFRYQEQAQQQAGWVSLTIREKSMSEALAKLLAGAKLTRVGFEANFTTFGQVSALRKELGKLKVTEKQLQLTPVEDVLVNLRKVKDDHEIDLTRKSIAINEEAFEAVREQIKVGLSENDLAGMLISELRSRGAEGTSFDPIVAAGANSSLPHYRAGQGLVAKNMLLLFDWGCLYRGYCSDLTRTLLIGQPNKKLKEIYKIVLDAQLAAIEFIRPGVTNKQVDKVARDLIDAAGYKHQFGHGLGHGIGRDIHELPTLRFNAGEDELRPGMIVTVEPGIYLPGQGGVRIEDDVLITHSGCEVLSTLGKSLAACHLE